MVKLIIRPLKGTYKMVDRQVGLLSCLGKVNKCNFFFFLIFMYSVIVYNINKYNMHTHTYILYKSEDI